jgi:hypothetical protein
VTPNRHLLSDVERSSFALLRRDATSENHRAWLKARAAILAEIEATGRVLESCEGTSYTVYRKGRYGQLTRRTFDFGTNSLCSGARAATGTCSSSAPRSGT